MEQARQAVEAFMARNGRHDTTVHETVAPAVTHEIVTKVELRNVTKAIDREVHQDHFHTSVQPITDTEYREEQHHSITQPVDVENYEHGDAEDTARRLAEVDAEHHDTLQEVVAERRTTELPAIEGLHIHHHVHERIQPVIQKQTYETHVYHVVVPVREIHHNVAHHHPSSPLPTVTMAEFKRSGGSLTGREERYDAFEGEPRSVGKALGGRTFAAPPTTGASKAPAPAAEVASGNIAPPVKTLQMAPVAAQSSVALEPNPQPDPTTIASRTELNSGVFRPPTRAPTAPESLAREPMSVPGLTRAPTSPAQLAQGPPAPASLEAAVARASTVPSVPTSQSAQPAPLAREPTSLAQLSRAPTVPAPLPREPTIPAPLQREPTMPAPHRDPTTLPRESTVIAPNHPLMRPPTLLPQDAYREGRGRAGSVIQPPQRNARSRPPTPRPSSPS